MLDVLNPLTYDRVIKDMKWNLRNKTQDQFDVFLRNISLGRTIFVFSTAVTISVICLIKDCPDKPFLTKASIIGITVLMPIINIAVLYFSINNMC